MTTRDLLTRFLYLMRPVSFGQTHHTPTIAPLNAASTSSAYALHWLVPILNMYLMGSSRLQIPIRIVSVPPTRLTAPNCISGESFVRELLTATGNFQDVRNCSQAP